MRRSPIPWTVFACVRLKPMTLLTRVTVRRFAAAVLAVFFAMFLGSQFPALRADHLGFFLAAHPRDQGRVLPPHQPGEGGPHDVVRVRRAERLRQHVLDAARLAHRAHGAAGDQAGAFRRRLEQHAARTELADHLVRNRRALAERDPDQVLLCRLDALLDGRRHFLRLADAEADDAVAVADDHQRAEAQVLAALDDLRHAVDRDDGVLDLQLRRLDFLPIAVHQCHYWATFSKYSAGRAVIAARSPAVTSTLVPYSGCAAITTRTPSLLRAP